jgi:hypothetical protein
VLLGRQTLDGVAVDAIQADGVLDRPALRVTLYFNAATHVLQGFDAAVTDPSYSAPSWQVRLRSASMLASSAAPTGMFEVPFPSGARVVMQPDLRALPRGCGIADKGQTPGAKTRLAVPGNTILATCQRNDPSLTADQIVAALAAPARAQLEEAVATGALTPTRAADALTTLEGQLAPSLCSSWRIGSRPLGRGNHLALCDRHRCGSHADRNTSEADPRPKPCGRWAGVPRATAVAAARGDGRAPRLVCSGFCFSCSPRTRGLRGFR